VFIDDVIIFSRTAEEHALRLANVLQRFEGANLQLQPEKCVFAQPEGQYLGHVISREGIRASPYKVKAVKEYPIPKTVKGVRSFLGLASYYRRLVPPAFTKSISGERLLFKRVCYLRHSAYGVGPEEDSIRTWNDQNSVHEFYRKHDQTDIPLSIRKPWFMIHLQTHYTITDIPYQKVVLTSTPPAYCRERLRRSDDDPRSSSHVTRKTTRKQHARK
jgi:hypothetical protein